MNHVHDPIVPWWEVGKLSRSPRHRRGPRQRSRCDDGPGGLRGAATDPCGWAAIPRAPDAIRDPPRPRRSSRGRPPGARGGERHVSAPMLTIHTTAIPRPCGIPPVFSNEAADLYIGYLENRYGE